ncbi:ProQ/FINO family protein (plasmid) [Halobacteriovorax sp. GFR7]|uniref:ProQ/FINO family protein n=1 Tax=unclassified Halobacteriovorax TaxID=2639665 RepID=UPI003D95DEA0
MQESKKKHNKDRSKAYFQRRADQIKALNPKLFSQRKPSVLTKNIKEQIKAALPELSNSVINKFLMFWVRRDRYLSATIACPSRMNLDGTFAEPITDEERLYAQSALRLKRKKEAPRTSRSHNRNQRTVLSPSEATIRQRAILERAGKGLNFPIQSDKKDQVEVIVKKRKTLQLPKRVDGKGE